MLHCSEEEISDTKNKRSTPHCSGALLGRRRMDSGRGSSSEATESNDKAVATGMMTLLIACKHVEQESNKHAEVAGK